MTVPDEAVEHVFNVYRANLAWEGTEAKRRDRFRVALEASGAVFLSDEERQALLWALSIVREAPVDGSTGAALEAAQEKLT